MSLTQSRSVFTTAIAAFTAAWAAGAMAQQDLAQQRLAPTPKIVIYPGDVIRDDMLADNPMAVREGPGPYVESRALIIGKVARLTLFPGHAIPFSGIVGSFRTALRSSLSIRRAVS
jgi:flagella basal body P-ring formation protein FlgA